MAEPLQHCRGCGDPCCINARRASRVHRYDVLVSPTSVSPSVAGADQGRKQGGAQRPVLRQSLQGLAVALKPQSSSSQAGSPAPPRDGKVLSEQNLRCADTVSPGPLKILLPGQRLFHIPACLWVDSVQLPLGHLVRQNGAKVGELRLRLPLRLPNQLQQKQATGVSLPQTPCWRVTSEAHKECCGLPPPMPQQSQSWWAWVARQPCKLGGHGQQSIVYRQTWSCSTSLRPPTRRLQQ